MNELERKLIDALLFGPGQMLADLRKQYEQLSVTKRDFTGCGFFTHFISPATTPRVTPPDFHIGDLYLDVVETEAGADAILFVRDGLIDFLEVVAVTGSWPDNPTIRSMEYVHAKYTVWSLRRWLQPDGRDFNALRKSWAVQSNPSHPHVATPDTDQLRR